MKTWLRRATVFLAYAYPVALLVVVLLFALIGDDVWFVGVAQYLPRLGFALPLPVIACALFVFGLRRLLSIQAVSVFLLVFPLLGFVLPSCDARDERVPMLRLVSYNVNSAHAGEPRVVDVVMRYAADIVVLQEAAGRAESLARRLSEHYPHVYASTQFVTASRYPILSTYEPDKIPLEDRQRSPRFISHVLDTPLGKVALYNVHPISPRDGFAAIRGQGVRRELFSGRLLMAQNVADLRVNSRLRELQLRYIATRAKAERAPVIIAGDMNLPTLSPLMRRYLADYDDGFRTAAWGFGYTFPTDKPLAWMRLDRVLASPELRFVHFEVGQDLVSDHRPVMAELQ